MAIWDTEAGSPLLNRQYDYKSTPYSVAFSSDQKHIALGDWSGAVRVCDARTGKETLVFQSHSGAVSSVAFSPDGSFLASAGEQGVRFSEIADGRELRRLSHNGTVHEVAISPDGQFVASSCARPDSAVHVWQAATGQKLFSLTQGRTSPTHVAYSRDGRLLAVAFLNATAKVWDVSTQKELLSLAGHSSSVSRVAFHPDGERLAVGTYDGSVVIWDLTTGREALTLKLNTMDAIMGLAFSPNGRWLAAGNQGGVTIWDGQPLDQEPQRDPVGRIAPSLP